MSDRPVRPSGATKTITDSDILSAPVANRRVVLAWGAGVIGAALVAPAAQAQVTDRDPGDPVGRGRGGGTGITDRDPTDPAGRGRGTNPPRPPQQGQTGITDRDPTDPAGRGRGTNPPRPPQQGQTGITDRDPTDPAGRGRGTTPPQQASVTDRDAVDLPGRGRGAAGNTGWSDGDQGTQRDLPGRGRRPPQSVESDNDIGPRADPRQRVPGQRPPQRPPAAGGQGVDIVDVGVGRNDAARLVADARDVLTHGDAARLRNSVKRRGY